MDPSTASYYRAILFVDSQDQRPLPPSLMQLHAWAVKRNHALGLGGVISKAVALTVAMSWMSSTKDGRAFTRDNTSLGDFFDDPSGEQEGIPGLSAVDWDTLPVESDVIVTLGDNKTQKAGKFLGRRGNWLDVRVDGELKHFKTSKVQLSGA